MFYKIKASHLKWEYRKKLALYAVLILSLNGLTTSAGFGNEPLLDKRITLPYTHKLSTLPSFQPGSELLVSGENKSDNLQLIIIRIDNGQSSSYYTRLNKEFTVAPGYFSVVLPLTGLKTSAGALLEQPYSKLHIFTDTPGFNLELREVSILTDRPIPGQTLALDFGSNDSPLYRGFQPVTKESPYLQGKVSERVRVSGDALIQDGIHGIDSVTIPWRNGQWKLTLWIEDQGELEYLPHALNRKIIAGKTPLVDESFTRERWIQQVYLAGSRKEGELDGDPWELIGKRRSGMISKTVDITGGSLSIQLRGEYEARYISALILEPVDGEFASSIEAQRKNRFLNTWPVANDLYHPPRTFSLEDISHQVADNQGVYLSPRGTLLNLTFEIRAPVEDYNPVVVATPPHSTEGDSLSVTTRYGHWRYERPEPNASSLILDDSYLRSDLGTLRLSRKRPRRLSIQVNIPVSAPPGEYTGNLQVLSHDKLYLQEYKIKVLPMTLPRLRRPVGLYLEPAPFYHWFSTFNSQVSIATACDLELLSRYGFSTVAPALATPDNDQNRKQFVRQIKQIKRYGFQKPVLAYAPLKRLLSLKTEKQASVDLQKLGYSLHNQQLPYIYWTVFDEPKPEAFTAIERLAERLRKAPLGFKTAGHMNRMRQRSLNDDVDLLLVNSGFGLTGTKINNLKQSSTLWLYNMPTPRVAAGAYLWRSGAHGYLQWHGRMPSADPFDPTDGRRDDAIYLYPSEEKCPPVMNIHRRLLDLHEATIDLRWLEWLEEEADRRPEAKTLMRQIKKSVPDDWEDASLLSAQELLEIRRKILELSELK